MITHRAATVNIPKPPPEQTAKAIQRRRELRRRKEAGVSFLCCIFLLSYLCPIKPNNLMLYDNDIIKPPRYQRLHALYKEKIFLFIEVKYKFQELIFTMNTASKT